MIAPTSAALRFVRGLFTFWLAFVLTQPVAVHACAMRNGTLMPVATAPAGHAEHGSTGAPVTMDMTDAMLHGAPSPAGQTSHGCHCFGECAVSAAVALVTPRYAVPAPPDVQSASVVDVSVERSFEPPTYLHPPATAPPTA